MRTLSMRRRVAVAGATGLTALIAAVGIGVGTAAAVPADPPGGSTPVAPSFNNGVVNAIRGAGSDTTFFVMQKLGDLYTGAGLYGCTLNPDSSNDVLYNSLYTDSSSNEQYYCESGKNTSTTDTDDNWSRTEVSEGVDDIGSGAGQSQLCGSATLSSPLPVDFARSSKPVTVAPSCDEVATGFAKDSVPIVEYPVNPSTYGTAAAGSVYASINGGNVGPVSSGWLPGDPVNGSANSGTALTDISDIDNGGLANSTAYRLWCASGAAEKQITDWGSLTNLGPNMKEAPVTVTSGVGTISGTFPTGVTGGTSSGIAIGDAVTDSLGYLSAGTTVSAVSATSVTVSPAPTNSSTSDILTFAIGGKVPEGQGAPVGIPVRIQGGVPTSGTEYTFGAFAQSGDTSGNCSANANQNAAGDPNPATATGGNAGPHLALENNASQTTDFAAGDWPGDYADQAIETATTLYDMSNGVYGSSPYSGSGSIDGNTFSVTKLTENGQLPSTIKVLNNTYPTARTLNNIYQSTTVRASTAGFLNWLCDSTPLIGGSPAIAKEKDNSTGLNFDNEIANIISSFGFLRIYDGSAEPSQATPADGLAAPNTTCASGTVVNGGVTYGNGIPAVTAVAQPEK